MKAGSIRTEPIDIRPKDLRSNEVRMFEYSVRDCAEYFGVTPPTIHKWIKQGRLRAEERTETKNAKRVGKYIVTQDTLDEIDRRGRMLIFESRRHWVRMLWQKDNGLKVR